jgi:hypothetical protein
MQFERLAVRLGERVLTEPQLDDSVQGIDDVLPRLFTRLPPARNARDFGDRGDNPALLSSDTVGAVPAQAR